MELVGVVPGALWLLGRRPFVHLLAEAAEALGGRLELEARFGHVGRFYAPSGRVRPIFGNALGLNPEAAAMLAADKDYTARLLSAEGLQTPRGMVLFSAAYKDRMALKNRAVADALPGLAEAESMADALGYPVILKPNSGSEGRGVHRPADAGELRTDLSTLFATDDRVRLEAYVRGDDIRVLVLDGVVRLAYRRVAFGVTGDGRQTIGALLAARLDALAGAHRGQKIAPGDPRLVRTLAAQGLTVKDVPQEGAVVRLLDNANLSTGGTLEDLSNALPPDIEDLAIRAAGLVGLRLAGVDLLTPDLHKGADAACVLEVNAAPGLDYYASAGDAQWAQAVAVLVDALSDGGRPE